MRRTALIFTFIIATLFSPLIAVKEDGESYRYTLAAAAIFRDEAPYLREWIEYHLLMGVEHFTLYNNLSADEYLKVLSPYIDSGIVDLIEWPYENDRNHSWAKIQKSCYLDALARAKEEVKWLFILDTDEFFVPIGYSSLAEFLATEEKKRENRKVGRYQFGWVLFGTSGVERVPKDKLLVEMLTRNEGCENAMYKSVVRPRYAGNKITPHSVNLIDQWKVKKVDIATAQINHYILRDLHFLRNVKAPRVSRYAKSSDYLWNIDNHCCHTNRFSDRISRFIPELKRRMEERKI